MRTEGGGATKGQTHTLSCCVTDCDSGGRRTPGLRHAPRTRTTESTRLPSGRHIQVLVNGEPLATTYRPALIIETGVPPRWYVPPGDVRWDRLTPSPQHTTCHYKGQACYWTVNGTNPPLPVWGYL